MEQSPRTPVLSRSFQIAASAAFSCLATLGAHAQSAIATPAVSTGAAAAAPARLDLSVPQLDLMNATGVGFSSSVSTADDSVETAALDFKLLPEDASQPPPRRRYGRPRYNDSSHNPDGSNKYGFLAGVGLTQPVGNSYHYLNPSYSYQVGVGRNFNKNFSVFLQFDWDNFGFNAQTIYNQTQIYQYLLQGNYPIDGNSHVWSFTLDPTYNIYAREGLGAYVVGGVGFYHKVATFFTPEVVQGYDYFGFPVQYEANATVDHYSSNAVGVNGGFGLTFKPSRFANEKFYAEARYVFVDNPARQGYTVNNYLSAPYTATNFFPANSHRTTYIPIKFGIRF